MRTNSAIRFLGAAGTVTGSKTLVSNHEKGSNENWLVDCGLFQGLKELRLMNRQGLPIDPNKISSVILTHAHLDHSGYLPLLVKNGFRGPIYCTPPTEALMKVILSDSAKIQEEDAEYANRKGFSKHSPAKPLYTVEDAHAVLPYVRRISDQNWNSLTGGARFRFRPSGHILGSAFVEFKVKGTRFLFSGDLGRSFPILLPAPVTVDGTDYLILESTYGDQMHGSDSPLNQLASIVNSTLEKEGVLIVPSFAVGRTQDLLYLFAKLKDQCRIPDVPIFLDSPMGIDATAIFSDYPEWHKIEPDVLSRMCKVATMVRDREHSKELLNRKGPMVVIAGSGMVTGGRVLHHLGARLPDEKNTVLLVGYQAAGTRGRLLRDGITELKMHGQYIPVKARVEEISGLSAHADQKETLEWLKQFKERPKKVFIQHGEPQASDALRVKIKDVLGWECVIPKLGDAYENL